MNETELQMIIDCLPKGKTKFYYYRNRYAQLLLSGCIGRGMAVSRVRQTNYARLLSNPLIKSMLEKAGGGILTPALLDSVWPGDYECYLLTLGKWGKNTKWIRPDYQTARPGWNLVLQLNFSAKHNRPYDRLIQPAPRHPFIYWEHPVAQNGYLTLAWSRIDLDLDVGQALIEEIQNDWIRDALWAKKYVQRFLEKKTGRIWEDSYYSRGLNCKPRDIIQYVDTDLADHIGIWDEAMLSATIWFLLEELGIKTIYYHTFETGNRLKYMGSSYSRPPRSLYTKLPRRFCFEMTEEGPRWILSGKRSRTRSLKKLGPLTFWRLTL